MSANNLAICPKCEIKRKNNQEELTEIARNAYGKVSEKEFAKLHEEATGRQLIEPGHSLQENFEIGIDEEGYFAINYGAKCKTCGFKFNFNHEEWVP